MGPKVGGDPPTIAAAASVLTKTATTASGGAKAIGGTGDVDTGSAGLSAALARFVAAGQATSSAVATELDALALLARHGAQDLTAADGQPTTA